MNAPRRRYLVLIICILVLQLLVSNSCEVSLNLDFGEVECLTYVTMENGAITTKGYDDSSIDGYEGWSRTAFFVRTDGADEISLPKQLGRCRLVQYDEGHNVVSVSILYGSSRLEKTCSFVRFAIRDQSVPAQVGIKLLKGKSVLDEIVEEKRVQVTFPYDRLVYQVDGSVCTTALLMLPPNYNLDGEPVPLIIWDSGDGSFRDWDNYQGGQYEGRLRGLQYLRDQGFAVLEIYSWGSSHFKKHPGCGGRSAMPIPTHLATHEKGVKYVTSRYNINPDKVFEVSKSGSGKISLYWAMESPSFNLKAIFAFAPVFDDLNFVGWGMDGYRKALYEELDLQGTEEETTFFLEGKPYNYDIAYCKEHSLKMSLSKSWQIHDPLGRSFIMKNAEKFKMVSVDWYGVEGITLEQLVSDTHSYSAIFWEGYNRHYDRENNSFSFSWDSSSLPAEHNNCYTRHDLVRQNSGIPFTVIMSPDDEQTPYWNALEVVRQLQNGGADAQIITLKGGGHSGPDLSTGGANVVNDVTTRLGIHYDNVSIGWYTAVEDIYSKYLADKEILN